MTKGKTTIPQARGGKVQLSTFVPVDLHQAVAALAAREDRSISAIVKRAVEAELEKAAA